MAWVVVLIFNFMKRYILSFLFATAVICSFAQNPQQLPDALVGNDLLLTEEIGQIPESLDANIDSLLHTWHVKYFTKRNAYCHDDAENVFFPDSVYAERLSRLPRVIPMPYNNVVRNCIDLYAERKRGLVKYMLGMADFYFPIIEQVLDEHGLPLELKYLAVVESALNPVALSRVGACGLWQFMLPTGKMYGLEINSLVDERRDPLKSTHAACKYFEDMYRVYGDWNLVLASYNCGPGNVNKAIRRAGGKKDFWEIFPYLPKETRSYVPLFIAANYIMNYYCDHNICPVETNLPMATDTVMIKNNLHLQQVADILHLDLEEIRALNPQYKRDIIPGNTEACVLKLPAAETYAFVDKANTVYLHKAEELLANCVNTQSAGGQLSKPATQERITHVVLHGENLYTIANRYGVTAREIKKWNRLSSTRVAKGKRLVLYVDNGGVTFASAQPEKEKTENRERQASSKGTAKQVTSSLPENTVAKANTASKGTLSYIVKSGDSLYSIAKRYPGVSTNDLLKANGLSSSSIRPGQKLKIPRG